MVVLVVVVLTAEAYLANRSPGRDPANG